MGGEKHFAAKAGVSAQLVYAIEIGTREPRGRVLDALGLEAAVTYRRKPPQPSAVVADSGEGLSGV